MRMPAPRGRETAAFSILPERSVMPKARVSSKKISANVPPPRSARASTREQMADESMENLL